MGFERKTLRWDICLILAISLVGLCLFFVLDSKADSGSFATVEVDGVVVASYSLSKDGVYAINGGKNTIEIRDGKVRMLDADCPNRQCVMQSWISRGNQSIICLPNKVVITINGGDPSVDFVL